MKIKVCGMRDADNIREIARLAPDYMGFIFYKSSPRCCVGIKPSEISALPEEVIPVMVTVDMDETKILELAERYGFKTVQLHGHESPECCFSLRCRGLTVWKAMGIRSEESLENLREYEGSVDAFLLDTACSTKGGSGRKFDWDILATYNLREPFFLSGGIGPHDAEAVRNIRHPRFAGVDLNSRFETEPGRKDSLLLESFMCDIRKKTLDGPGERAE